MLEFEIVDSPDHRLVEVVRELFREYETELDVSLCFQDFDEELATLPGKYAPPNGILQVLLDDGEPIACGALRALDESTCELKRIYIRPQHRGKGLGRKITVDLMNHGKRLGYTTVRLDTMKKLIPAETLYRSLGFKEIQPYSHNPGLEIVYFERVL